MAEHEKHGVESLAACLERLYGALPAIYDDGRLILPDDIERFRYPAVYPSVEATGNEVPADRAATEGEG